MAESQTLLSRLELANGSTKDALALHGYDSVDKALNLEVGEVQAPDEAPTTHWFRFVCRGQRLNRVAGLGADGRAVCLCC